MSAGQNVINLLAGKVLTVTAGAATAGHLHRKTLGGTSTNYPRIDLFESQSRVLGPFADDRDYVVTTDYGPALVTSIGVRADNNVANLEGDGAPASNVLAALSTNLTGTNNDLVFTAVPSGVAGNRISIKYLDPAANSASLAVAVTTTPQGSLIVFSLATDSGGVITTIASDISDLAGTALAELVTVANKAANDGTGLVIAMAATHLAGGISGTGADIAGPGSRYTDYTNANLYLNAGTQAAPTWKLVTRAS